MIKNYNLELFLSNYFGKNVKEISEEEFKSLEMLSLDGLDIEGLYEKIDFNEVMGMFPNIKKLVINNYVLKQSLEKSINDCIYIDDIMKFISTLTTIEINELTKTSEFIKKSLCFIIDNHIKDINEVMNELKNIYFKIKNIDWLFVQE